MARSSALYRNKTELQARLKELPASPGVYRFYDVSDAIVYVGKSVCLRDRVRSYFSGQAATTKLRRLRQEIVRFDWDETGSELEALLLESRLVKRHQPRFNVLLRDFVPLPYVRVDLEDPFPRLEVTRKPERDGAAYYGPFRSHGVLETAVGALSDALQLRDCPIAGERIREQRPCYRYEFGTCSAPCLGVIEAATYREAVGSACLALEGEEQTALQALVVRMERAAERLQFEIAARLRDAVRHIQAISGRQQAIRSAIRELSLVAACPSRDAESLCLFVFRCGRLVLQQEASVKALRDRQARRAWARRLAAAEAPRMPESGRFDAALMDEIQIVTGWMKQKTRQGAYWEFPSGATRERLVRELDAWLAEQARLAEPGDLRAAA